LLAGAERRAGALASRAGLVPAVRSGSWLLALAHMLESTVCARVRF